jgi:hypothetical protein
MLISRMDTIIILYVVRVHNCKSFQNQIAYFTVYSTAQAKQINLIIIHYWFKYMYNTAEYYVFCYSILEMKVQFILGPQAEGRGTGGVGGFLINRYVLLYIFLFLGAQPESIE